jgi:hypothetical protein
MTKITLSKALKDEPILNEILLTFIMSGKVSCFREPSDNLFEFLAKSLGLTKLIIQKHYEILKDFEQSDNTIKKVLVPHIDLEKRLSDLAKS